jgi:hypothetical protein
MCGPVKARRLDPKMLAVELTALALLVFMAAWYAAGCEPKSYGSSLDCENIRDHDGRFYCLAISKNDKTYCEGIKDPDMRNRCRAMVRP